MADMLLDESLFHNFRLGDQDARKIVESIIDGDIKAALSPLTVHRLWRSPDLDRRTEIGFLSLMQFLEVADLTTDAAKTAGLWLSDIDDADAADTAAYFALLASTAMQLGIPICTRNPDPFIRFGAETTPY